MTNSSISLPTCLVKPRTMAPVASSGVGPLAAKASGLRKAAIRPISRGVERGVQPIELLGQHRVPEAIDRVGKLGNDRGIDGGVVSSRGQERVDLRLNRAREFLEHEVLILHLSAELRRLEQTLTIPDEIVYCSACRDSSDIAQQPLIEKGDGFGLGRPVGKHLRGVAEKNGLSVVNETIMLGVKDGVDRGETDVLVHTAIARDIVGIEQFVVVEA